MVRRPSARRFAAAALLTSRNVANVQTIDPSRAHECHTLDVLSRSGVERSDERVA